MGDPSKCVFPNIEAGRSHFGDSTVYSGITKRELFAAMAMQGDLASQSGDGFWGEELYPVLASRCVKIADALIKELNRGK